MMSQFRFKEIRKELAVTVLAILLYMFVGLIFVPIIESFCESRRLIAYLAFIMGAIVAGYVSHIVYGKWYEEDANTGRLGFSFKAVAFGTIGSFAIANIISGIRSVVECFMQNDIITQSNVETGVSNWSNVEILVLIIATALIGPMVEELIFRGLLLNTLWKVFSFHKAIIISSLCFGLLHGNSVMTMTSATLMGIVLAYTYAINRNLMDSIIAHLIYNTFVTYVAVHATLPVEHSAPELSEVLNYAIPLVIVSAVVCVTLGILYIRLDLGGRHEE